MTPGAKDSIMRCEARIKSLIYLDDKVKSCFTEPSNIRPMAQIAADLPDADAFCFSLDRVPRKIGRVLCLPWDEGIKALGL